jgi:hypothetical protein
MQRDDWVALLVSIVLAILLPWWVIVLVPIIPLILIGLVCALFRWK